MHNQHKQAIIPYDVLHAKYYSTQIYYYTRVISDIVQEAEGKSNTRFQDIVCLIDDDEYYKRLYRRNQFEGKMATFKQYYFYHQHCPRIHTEQIEIIYNKWQDRKRDLIYHKLKAMYNQPPSDSQDHTLTPNLPVSHFLLNISEYNPFSKKYYLRVQAKHKEKVLHKTKSQISQLKHELSIMLHGIPDISEIDGFSPTDRIQKRIRKINKHYNDPTRSNSQDAEGQSQHYSSIKLNFQKAQKIKSKKSSTDKIHPSKSPSEINKISLQVKKQRKKSMKNSQGQKSNDQNFQSLKSRSIYSVNSFAHVKVQPSSILNKERKLLKIDSGSKPSNFHEWKPDVNKNYESQKVEQKKITIKTRSNGKVKPSPELIKKQNSRKKLLTRPDEFNDQRLIMEQPKQQLKIRSHKSEFFQIKSISNSRKNLFQIKAARQDFMRKGNNQKQKGLELKKS